MKSYVRALLLLAALVPPGIAGAGPGQEASGGMVVETVVQDWPGARAGLQPGDVILSWSRDASPPANPEPARGILASPFDLEVVRIEEAPRGVVRLHGRRDAEPMTWTVPPGWWWALTARPAMSGGLLAEYLAGLESFARGAGEEADKRWAAMAEQAAARADRPLAAWLSVHRATALQERGLRAQADAPLSAAVDQLAAAGQPLAAAVVAYEACRNLTFQSQFERSIACLERGLELASRGKRKTIAEGWLLVSRATVANQQGDSSRAEALLREAIARWHEQAPGSQNLSYALNTLGVVAADRGDLARAEEAWREALEIQERLEPSSLTTAMIVSNLGMVRYLQGDLEAAESDLEKVLALHARMSMTPEAEAQALTNLALVAIARGDHARAEQQLRAALAIAEKDLPGHPVLPAILASLGSVERARGDLRGAASFFGRALELRARSAPEGEGVASDLVSLGEVATLLGDLATAREHLGRALALREKSGASGILVAESLLKLGQLETREGGDPEAADRYLQRALSLIEAQLPQSLLAAEALGSLGRLAQQRGDLAPAEELLRRALALRQKISPGSRLVAEALNALGHVERARGRQSDATAHLCAAIDVLDRQRTRVGATLEGRAVFEAGVTAMYQECLEAQWMAGRPKQAFHALERGRARAFLRLLAERRLQLAELGPEVRAERGRLDREYDRLQESLGTLSLSKDGGEIDRIFQALREVQARQADLAARLVRDSPRVAALEYPPPLDLAAARAALDPGTLLLAYAAGEESTYLFAVRSAADAGPGIAVFRLPLGRAELEREIAAFQSLLRSAASDARELHQRGERLREAVLGPASTHVQRARRLLISPDGPLHALPFGALVSEGRFLATLKPLHMTPSVTVYSALRRGSARTADRPPVSLVAFGDPLYPPAAGAGSGEPTDAAIGSAIHRGLRLSPLPSSRREIEEIASGFTRPRVFLGAEATEERAKAVSPQARILHFATHGFLDERLPLNSALALSIPSRPTEGQENGLLQAWEIFESLRLDADLVTLSACDTALGKDMGGEGLLGLTRAFQFAGARSVLASLWSVADDSTAELMKHFYAHLRGGKPKDEALRAAQVEMLRSGDPKLAHPYAWAGFQLYGDWR